MPAGTGDASPNRSICFFLRLFFKIFPKIFVGVFIKQPGIVQGGGTSSV
jgi:hypothetical protein